jgi:hypothetical protein
MQDKKPDYVGSDAVFGYRKVCECYFTVTDFAKFLGMSGL